jgi:hypothetical protein
MSKCPYRIIHSPNLDWIIAAKRTGREVALLYEGDCIGKALGSILEDAGIEVGSVSREGLDENSAPKLSDWKD